MSPPPKLSRLASLALLVSLVSWQMGCVAEEVPTGGTPVSSNAADDSSSDPEPTPAGPSLDELFLTVARESPGFAGLFIDEAGYLVIQVVDSSEGDSVREAVSRVFGLETGAPRSPHPNSNSCVFVPSTSRMAGADV